MTCGAPLPSLPLLPAQVGLAGGSSIPSPMLQPGVSPPQGTVWPDRLGGGSLMASGSLTCRVPPGLLGRDVDEHKNEHKYIRESE